MSHFFEALLTCSAAMSVVAALYMAAIPLLEKRYTHQSCYCAGLVIMIGLLIPFRPAWHSLIQRISPAQTMITPVSQLTEIIVPTAQLEAAAQTAQTFSVSIGQIAACLWVAGMGGYLLFQAIRHYRFTAMIARWAEPVSNDNILYLTEEISKDMGIRTSVSVQTCPLTASPMLFGFFKPVILLPRIQYTDHELYFILQHELYHYKRKDLWAKILTMAAAALHWFNPLVHLAAKAVDVQCELSCDEALVKNADSETRRCYCETIVNSIRKQQSQKTALSTNFLEGKKNMKKRLQSIMDTNKKKTGLFIISCLSIITLASGYATPSENNLKPADTAVSGTADAVDIDNPGFRAELFAPYAAFGLVYDEETDALYFNQERVRYFEDFYPVGDELSGGSSGIQNFDENGTVDVHGVRDLSRITPNEDGSYDPSGILIGAEPYSQEEFDARDIDAILNPPQQVTALFDPEGEQADVIIAQIEPDTGRQITVVTQAADDPDEINNNEIALSTSVAVSGDLHPDDAAKRYAVYEPYGLIFDKETQRLYFEGKLVRHFEDILKTGPSTYSRFLSHTHEDGEIDVHTVFDEDGEMIGIEPLDRNDFLAY